MYDRPWRRIFFELESFRNRIISHNALQKKRDPTSTPIYTNSRWMILDTRKTFTYSICTKLHLLKNVYNKIIQFFSLSFFRRTMKVQRWKYHIVLLLSATAFVNDLWFVINMCLKFWPEINCRTLPTKEIKTDIMFHREGWTISPRKGKLFHF
jgi:hypothetical protein